VYPLSRPVQLLNAAFWREADADNCSFAKCEIATADRPVQIDRDTVFPIGGFVQTGLVPDAAFVYVKRSGNDLN
jgi:hypothetical protein